MDFVHKGATKCMRLSEGGLLSQGLLNMFGADDTMQKLTA
jgi:hypothetical protein